MRRLSLPLAALLVASLSTLPAALGAQQPTGQPATVVESKAKSGVLPADSGFRAAANLVGGRAKELAGSKTAASGTHATLWVNNATNLYIKIWVAGTYVGEVPSWGDLYAYFNPGSVGLYARADYSDGTVKWWRLDGAPLTRRQTYQWKLSE